MKKIGKNNQDPGAEPRVLIVFVCVTLRRPDVSDDFTSAGVGALGSLATIYGKFISDQARFFSPFRDQERRNRQPLTDHWKGCL